MKKGATQKSSANEKINQNFLTFSKFRDRFSPTTKLQTPYLNMQLFAMAQHFIAF